MDYKSKLEELKEYRKSGDDDELKKFINRPILPDAEKIEESSNRARDGFKDVLKRLRKGGK